MIVYLSENQQNAIEAVAIRGSFGRGSNAVGYEVKDAAGRWHIIHKKHNPHIKTTIKRSDCNQWADGGRIGYSREIELQPEAD